MEVFWFCLISVSFLIIGLYAAMVFYAIAGWNKLKTDQDINAFKEVSILIAARNEADNIGHLLDDLACQNYPTDKFEVIVIDDSSEDETYSVSAAFQAKTPNLSVLKSQNGIGKKAALRDGISSVKFPIIATIDADCRVSSNWISAMLSNWRSETKMLLGPIVLAPANSLLESIQSMEMMAIMGLTGGFAAHGKPIMANGANLVFDKAAFETVGGFDDQTNPSGDDVFTMLKMNSKWPGSVAFVKDFNAIVQTAPQPSLAGFWQQRKRWLSKKGEYKNSLVNGTAILTYLANFIGLIALFISIAKLGTYISDLLLWTILVKTVVDLILIRRIRTDLNPVCGVGSIIPAELFILVYVTLLGLFGRVKNYTWKGRTIKVDG